MFEILGRNGKANHAQHVKQGKTHGDCDECQQAMRNYAMQHKAQSKPVNGEHIVEQPSSPTMSDADVLKVRCLACDAQPGQPCVAISDLQAKHAIAHFHRPRKLLACRSVMAEFWPKATGQLDDQEKSMIAFYSFVILADSVAKNSVKMFGKQFTSKEIQIFFTQRAIAELRRDCLL